MSRKREYLIRFQCKHAGCQEWSFYSYPTQREYRDGIKRQAGASWKCIRHNDDRLLGLNKLTASRTITSSKSTKYPELNSLFFEGHGFIHGNCWKAFADDFPEGTKIIETVTVILPEKRDENETK